MKLFRNYKTKRQLRAEISRLNHEMMRGQSIVINQYDVQTVACKMPIDDNVPIECIKKHAAMELSKSMMPFIEWNIVDSPENYPIVRQLYGKINIQIKK